MSEGRSTRALQLFFNHIVPAYALLLLYVSCAHATEACDFAFSWQLIFLLYIMIPVFFASFFYLWRSPTRPFLHLGIYLNGNGYFFLTFMSLFTLVFGILSACGVVHSHRGEENCFRTELGAVILPGLVGCVVALAFVRQVVHSERHLQSYLEELEAENDERNANNNTRGNPDGGGGAYQTLDPVEL